MIDIDSLSWNLPIEEQYANISKIQNISDDDIEMLILPPRRQACWKNCAIVLSTLSDARLAPFLPKVLEWYKDLNWPGIDIIKNRIAELPSHLVRDALPIALGNAKYENDDEWYDNLTYSFYNRMC